MTDADKDKLAKKLAGKTKEFPLALNNYISLKRWFVRKIIDHLSSTGTADAQLESETAKFIKDAKTLANGKKSLDVKIKFPGKSQSMKSYMPRTFKKKKMQVMYGALAMHPELLKSNLQDYFDFIIKRRLRSVFRMDYYVNPNWKGYFRYPRTCSALSGYQVNQAAQPYWVSFSPYGSSYFQLKSPSGTSDPVLAVKKLFTRYKRSQRCNGNLQECARVLNIVLLDSLLEAKTETPFYHMLKGKLEPSGTYSLLHIGHANPPANKNFLSDTSSQALFTKKTIKVDDLQIGDHLYIFNHPLYRIFRSGGAWRGEHSLMYDSNYRGYKKKNGFKFGGHGKEGTLYQFYTSFLKDLKTDLSRAYKMAKLFLNYRSSGSGSFTTSSKSLTVTIAELKDATGTGLSVTGTFTLYQYPLASSFSYYKYNKRGRVKKYEKGFVVYENSAQDKFYLSPQKNLYHNAANISAGDTLRDLIEFRKVASPSGPTHKLTNWAISYYNPVQKLIEVWEIFKNNRFTPPTFKDLLHNPFYSSTPGSVGTVNVTMPRISDDATYQTFLKNNGAF